MQDISDCLSLEAQNVAEARLAAKRAARAEAREIRMKELERQQKEVEERPDKDFGEKGSRPVSSLSAATLASLGGTSSRRGSGDTSISVDTEASIREIKDSLAEVEEKYKRSMVTNAQLDNEKTSLQYQVDTLRDVLLELEEELAETRRQYEDKHKESERQKHDQNVLRFQLSEMKEALEQRESLLTKHGIPLDSVGTPNGDASLDPHVNADGRPDPPIRTTSMGPSEEAVEKKETMPVVGEIPPSKAEQTNQEELLSAPSETQQNVEVGDKVKEQNIQETASSSNDADGALTGCQINLEHQEGGQQLDLELTSNEYALDANECAAENINRKVFVQNLSEVQKDETMEQKNTSPEEIEVFQDALDDVVQSPCLASEEQSISAGDFGSKNHNIGQQDLSKEEDRHEVQSTSVPITSGPNKEASVITDGKNDHHAETKDEHETSSPDDSSPDDSDESTAVELTIAAIEDQKVSEMEVKPEEQSVPDESGLLCKEEDSDKSDSNTSDTSSEEKSKSTEATIHADICIVVESDITPEQCLQDVQFTKEKPLVESENDNFGEVAGPCILGNGQSTVDNEVLEVSEALKDSVSLLDQHEDTTDAGILNLESPENGKTSTVFLGAQGTSQLELLNKREQDTFFDHPVCGDSENMNEKVDPFVPIAPAIELLGEGKQAKTSDHSDKIENTNDKVPVVAETPKEAVVSETLSSEGESTPEGEESDENNDEEVAVRSEKYTGESLPLGSSVDQISSDDDIRMEDGSDKASRRGKGKNKEDCVVS